MFHFSLNPSIFARYFIIEPVTFKSLVDKCTRKFYFFLLLWQQFQI